MTHVIGPWDEIKMSIKISKCTSDKIKSVRFLESYFTLARNFTVLVQSLGSHQPDFQQQSATVFREKALIHDLLNSKQQTHTVRHWLVNIV